MKFISQLVTAASGSIRGCTASRNRYGAYMRGRVIPVNPGSAEQNAVRGILANLVARWSGTLTPAERAAFETWAANTPQTDSLGQSITITGQNAYIKMNAPRLQAGLAALDTAPTIFSGSALTPPVLTIADQSDQLYTFTINVADEWATDDDARLLVYVGRPQNPSVNFFKGPYQFAEALSGSSGAPLTSPKTAAAVFPFVAGQMMHVQFRALAVDGRISSAVRSSIIAVA